MITWSVSLLYHCTATTSCNGLLMRLLVMNTYHLTACWFEHGCVHAVLCRFDIALNWFNPPMKVIDRTNVVGQHFLENIF